MKLPSFLTTSLRFLPRSLELLLVLALLWQLTGLFWRAATPKVAYRNLSVPTPAPSARTSSTRPLQDWFAPAQAQTAAPASDLQVLAIMSGEKGVAVIGVPQSPTVAVRVGDEIRAGTRLVGVDAGGVEVEQNGRRYPIALQDKAAAQIQSAVSPAQSAPGSEERIELTRGRLSGVLRAGNLAAWSNGVSTYRDGGILIESVAKQPLMQTLNLRSGDVLKRVDDKAIRNLADISALYHRLSQQSSVRLSILRGGSLQNMLYTLQP